ncbi:diguanylate cyclase [Streptomyces mirabilis]|nr:diguanylate cyclase [Streptomyces mirabilis]
MSEEPEPYVRLATLRRLQQVTADVNTARSLADTLQTVADGVVTGLGYELACVNLVRPDSDLVVAAVAGNAGTDEMNPGEVAARAFWDRRLNMGEAWGDLRFVPHTEGRDLGEDDVPQSHADSPAAGMPAPGSQGEWHPSDRLFAPMYSPGVSGASAGELIGVLSVDRPRNGQRPGAWGREALQMYAFQAAIAISNARLRANMQRALVRLEREQQALRASEESFRQAFEYAPSGMAIAEMGGDQHGRILRTNDALCRLLGRPASAMRRYSFSDLVHPEDIGTLLRTSAEGGRAELRLGRRDGTYVWVSLRNSVVADAADGPRFLLTHVEDMEERKRRELQLAHRASHDSLTGLPNSAEFRARLEERLCGDPRQDPRSHHVHTVAPKEGKGDRSKGLAVLFCDLDGMQAINDRFGQSTGDAVLVEVGRRLAQALREGDTVARYGGDEFVVLADAVSASGCRELVAHLREAIAQPIRVEGNTVRVGASIGTAWATCGTSVGDVLKAADLRMYEEKRARAAAPRKETQGAIVPERRTVGSLPDRTVGSWVPHRPTAQRQLVRTWPTSEAAASASPKEVEIHSGEEISRLVGSPHVHRVVLRGNIADLSGLRHLPVLRSLVIAENTVLSYLDDLEGCEKLRFLTVSGCRSLEGWAGVAKTGVMFMKVGLDHEIESLADLREARRLRELTLVHTGSENDPDLVWLRLFLPGVRIRSTPDAHWLNSR